MKKRRPDETQAEDEPRFLNAEGQLNSTTETETHRFVLRLMDARRASASFSPADAARAVRQAGQAESFGDAVLASWDLLDEAWKWPAAPCCSSAAEMVKRAGMKSSRKNGNFFWPDEGGRVPPAKSKAMVADLVIRIHGESTRKPIP